MIGRIVKEEQVFIRRLMEADGDYRRRASKNGEFALFGWRLDEFYEKAGREGVEFEERSADKKEKGWIYSRERNP
ncbi:hypothetical protein IMSAG185_00841 [Lachnospiraceae bacterium]|nr:hypothetical protein IMSAG185_00841 [Lachnospiraceae bacterium]